MFCVRNERKIIFILTVLTAVISTASGVLEKGSIPDKNISCGDDSEFPEDLFTKTQRKCGAIILHVIFAIYCFGAIALVCSERFLPTITCICEDLKLSEDVAAATFMSIATSAPELFSNIIGTFITESDIGIGHVIGNGYYNMFFVAALGGIAARKDVVLDWWPLTRDCAIYALVGLCLAGIVWDGVVKTYETLILLCLYIIYFIVMFNNKKIMDFVCRALKVETNVTKKEIVEEKADVEKSVDKKEDFEEAEAAESENEFTLPPLMPNPTPKAENERWSIFKKIFSMPITVLIRYTIPDVRKPKARKYYPVAFLLCVAWIGITTYLGTWMISVIGHTFGVSDLVMGMVFMAAGGSVVEAYCVYWKAKRGECSIGLSNCLGCNNLDATLCLALPWFIKTLPIQTSDCHGGAPGVVLESSLIHVNCLLLVVSVLALFAIFYLNKFKLNKKLGLICGGAYAVALFLGISVESYGKNE